MSIRKYGGDRIFPSTIVAIKVDILFFFQLRTATSVLTRNAVDFLGFAPKVFDQLFQGCGEEFQAILQGGVVGGKRNRDEKE